MKKKLLLTSLVFVMVFFVAGIIRVKAGPSENATGWGWGGGNGPVDGTNTNVGYISANNLTSGGGSVYGLNIPASDGDVTGYAWSENVGAIDFNPQTNCGGAYAAASCVAPDATGSAANGGVKRVGNSLVGWARFVEIAKASAIGNSGGWDGWIKMQTVAIDDSVDPNRLDGFAYSDELGWINLSRVTFTAPCTPDPSCAASLCASDPQCSDSCGNLYSGSLPAVAGSCGTANGIATATMPSTVAELCALGSSTPAVLSGSSPWSWTCSGVCGGLSATCATVAPAEIQQGNWREVRR